MSFRVFVSSTYEDLKHHRAHVIGELRRAGFSVDPMEDWSADPVAPRTFSAERAQACDLMVLLVAFRRGCIPPGETRSITQLEYEAATTARIDVLAFVLDDNAAWVRSYDERDTDPDVNQWRATLKTKHGVGTFGTEPSSVPIAPALTRWMQKRVREAAPGMKAPGALRIVEIRVTHSPEPKTFEEAERSRASTCVDFWVTNDGGSQVIITAVELDVVDTARQMLVKGAFQSSVTYDFDMTGVTAQGQHACCPISQIVEPGQSDRFTLRLVAPGLGAGVYAAWQLRPRLVTNYGEIEGDQFEAWLPYQHTGVSFGDLKKSRVPLLRRRKHGR